MASKLFSSFNQLSAGQLQVTNRLLGSGSYASVYIAYLGGVKCAAKKLHNIFFQYSDERSQQNDAKHAVVRFSEECRILSQISYHPNIIQFRGIYWESSNAPAPLLVMEYLPTSIDSLIEKCGRIPHEISYLLLHGIACGLEFLHSRTAPVIHRDLTAKNVLVSTDLRAKIADFGMATGHIRPNNMTQTPGNFIYMPPESMSANPSYDTSVDIFSFGVLAIYMLSGTLPIPRESAVQSDKSGGLRAVHEFSRRWDYLEMIGFTHPSINLIFQCIDNDPSSRASAAAIVSQVSDIVEEHRAPANYKERWKAIIERLERNEDVTGLIALEQQTQLQELSNVHVPTENDQISDGATCVGSARQEDNREQEMNNEIECSTITKTYSFSELIERCVHNETSDIIAAATKGSLSFILSGALLSEMPSQSLEWQIAHYILHCHLYLTPVTSHKSADKMNIMNSVTPSSPTTNCFSNMESRNSPIVPYRSLKSDRCQGAKVTNHLIAVVDMCAQSVTNGQRYPGLISFFQSGFTISHEVSKLLCITVSYDSLITTLVSILQALLCYINSLLVRIDGLKVTQAHVQLSALISYLSSSPNNLQAIWIIANQIETAVASIQYVNIEQCDSIHCEEACSIIEGQLLCKYGYQLSPTFKFTAQISGSVLDTPVVKGTHVTVSAPVVCPTTMGKVGMMKTHSGLHCGIVKECLSFEPTPLKKDTCSQYTSFQTAIHLGNGLSSLQNCIDVRRVELRLNTQQHAQVSHLIRQQSMDKVKANARINSHDHMSQLPVDKANQLLNADNSCLVFARKFGSSISTSTHGKPDKVTPSGNTPNSIKVAFPGNPNPMININWPGSESPPESNKTDHQSHVLVSPQLKFLFRGLSLKRDVASCLTFNTCTAAEVKTMITLLANLPYNGIELVMKSVKPIERASQVYYCRVFQLTVAAGQLTLSISATERTNEDGSGSLTSCESPTFLQPYQRDKQRSKNNSELFYQDQVINKGVSFSQLTGGTDKQDAVGNIAQNINSVLFSQSVNTSTVAVTIGFKFFLNQVVLYSFQIMQRLLTTTYSVYLLSQQTTDKTWQTSLPFNTCMRTCNKTSCSVQSYMYTEGKQLTASKERWKTIIERLERNEDVAEIITLEQPNQGQVQVTIEEQDSESSSLGITCVGSGKQEEANYPEHNREQKMSIKSISSGNNDMEHGIVNEMYSLIERCRCKEAVQMSDIIMVVTKGCYTLSGVSNIALNGQQIMGFQPSLILSGFAIPPTISKQIVLLLGSVDQQKGGLCKTTLHAAHITLTSIFQALSQCTYTVLTRIRIQELELTNPVRFSGYMHLSALSNSNKAIWIVTKTAVCAFINSELCGAIHCGDIYSIKEHLRCEYGYQKNSHTPSFIRLRGDCSSVVVCALTTPGTHNMHMLAMVSIPGIVYPIIAMTSSRLELKSNVGPLTSDVALDDPMLLMDTCSSLLRNHMCFQNLNQLSSQLSRLRTFTIQLNKGNTEFSGTAINKGAICPTRLDVHVSKPKINAETTRHDHVIILPLTADKANRHDCIGNFCLSLPRQFGVGIPPLTNSKPNKEVKSSPNRIKVTSTVAEKYHLIMKSETLDQVTSDRPKNPSDNYKTHHKGHMLTSPISILESLKHVAHSCLALNTCTAADMKTILALLACLPLDGLALKELIIKPHPIKGANPVYSCKDIQLLEETNTVQLITACQQTLSISATEATSRDNKLNGSLAITISRESLQPYQRKRQQSKHGKQNNHALSGGVLFSQLITDQIQDAMGNTININSVLSSKSTRTFIASDRIAFHLMFLSFHLKQTMLRTTHLLPLPTTIDKTWATLLPLNTCMCTCNKTSRSIQSYMYTEGKQLTASKFLPTSSLNPSIMRFSLNNSCSFCLIQKEEFGKLTRKKDIINRPILKPNTEGKLARNVEILIHLKQGTRVHTIDARLSKLFSMDAEYPLMAVIELQSLDSVIHLLHVSTKRGHQVLGLQNFLPHATHALIQELRLSQPLFIIMTIELNQYQTSSNINFDSNIAIYIRGMPSLPVTSKWTNLMFTYKSTHLEGMRNTWGGYYPPHMIGTERSRNIYASTSDHKNEVIHVFGQRPNRSPQNISQHVQIEEAIATTTDSSISTFQHTNLNLRARILFYPSTGSHNYSHCETITNYLFKDNSQALTLPEAESAYVSSVTCRLKFVPPVHSLTEVNQLHLQKSHTLRMWIFLTSIRHHLALGGISLMDGIDVHPSAYLKADMTVELLPNPVKPKQQGNLPNSLPFHMNYSNHSSDGSTNRNSDKGGARGGNHSGGEEDRDCGDQGGDRGGEDGCNKSGGDGGNYGDGGGSDGDRKKPSRKDQRSQRPNRKKKRKKGGERKRRHSTKQSSQKEVKKKKSSHVDKQSYLRRRVDVFSKEHYLANPDSITLNTLPMKENIAPKLLHPPTRIYKPQLRTWNPLELHEKFNESDRGRLDGSIHTYTDDNNDNRINGDERDSYRKEQMLISKVRKRRHPLRKRRRKRKVRRGKGRRRRCSTKRSLRKKKKSQKNYRLNSRSRPSHVQHEASHDQPSGAIVTITRMSSRARCPNVRQCVVPASSIIQNHQYLSFEQCQVLAHTRAWDTHVEIFQRRWLYCRPIARCRPVEISETSQTCNAIVHGRLLIHAARKQHFSVVTNGSVSRFFTPQVRLVRQHFNLSFIDDSRLGASHSVSNRELPSPQLHNDAAHNVNQPLTDAICGSLEDYHSDPCFPPPIMEQNIMVCFAPMDKHIITYGIN